MNFSKVSHSANEGWSGAQSKSGNSNELRLDTLNPTAPGRPALKYSTPKRSCPFSGCFIDILKLGQSKSGRSSTEIMPEKPFSPANRMAFSTRLAPICSMESEKVDGLPKIGALVEKTQ